MVLQGVEVPADKLGQRGSRGGYQEVRWAIVCAGQRPDQVG
jgi:hypothetical protein